MNVSKNVCIRRNARECFDFRNAIEIPDERNAEGNEGLYGDFKSGSERKIEKGC